MDEKTEILISLGASTAANCIPCFQYYFKKSTEQGVSTEDIMKAVEIGNKVKAGSGIAMTKGIRDITDCGAKRNRANKTTATSAPCCR